MNKIEYDNLTRAMEIYRSLVGSEHGYIEKKGNEDLFANYQDQGVNEVLNTICSSMKLRTFRGNKGRLYIVTDDDSVYAKNENEIKTYFYNQTEGRSERAYLFYYATLLLLNELFGGNPIRKRREYVPLDEWINILDTAVERHKVLTVEEELSLGFNFIRVGRRWKSLSSETDSTVVKINTKAGFLEKCTSFLEKEDLIYMDETRIAPTDKLIDLIERGNLRTDRLKELLHYEEEVPEDQE